MRGPSTWQTPVSMSACLRRVACGAVLASAAALLAGCSVSLNQSPPAAPPETPAAAAPPTSAIGTGEIKVGLILPMTAAGNAGAAARSMKNAAEMALAEFNSPNIQLLVKDDGGSAQGAQQAAQQALEEGAEILIGPLFAQAVQAAGQVARGRGVPVMAFSTDSSIAGRGLYLLSFLPEADVDRILDYAFANGKRSFAALLPDNAYGSVVEAEFKQSVARRGGRIVTLERYPGDKAAMQASIKVVAQAANQADALFIPDGAETVPALVQGLAASGVNVKGLQLLGTGLWDDPAISADPALHGAWFAAPDSAGYKNFSTRYRTRFGQDPVRTGTLAYDAVALVAALAKTQGAQRFSAEVLTGASGFSGIDGIFRFRPDGTNQRGLAVMRVSPSGPQPVSPPPKSFAASSGL